MKKLIEVEFVDGFVPPEKYEFRNCAVCPFCNVSDMDDWCSIEGEDNKCPIKQYFEEG